MINIRFLKDSNNQKQVLDKVTELNTLAKSGIYKYIDLQHRATQAFNIIGKIGVPPIGERAPEATSVEGYTITLYGIVKEMENHPPLMEMRVNAKNKGGAFRAIFFVLNPDKDTEEIYFTKAVIKTDTYSREFEDALIESELMMKKFLERGEGL